jgi:26S proteasome regulatory subunit T3
LVTSLIEYRAPSIQLEAIDVSMGDVVVEIPANTVAPYNKPVPSTIPNVETIEGVTSQGGDEYATLKKLQRHLEYIQLQEEYIKDEQR